MRKCCREWALIIILLLMLPAAHALAEWLPELDIQASIVPDAFVTPEEAELSFTLTNRSGETLERICLTSLNGTLIDNIGDLEADNTLSYTLQHTLTIQELADERLDYYITCVMGRDHYSYPVSIELTRLQAAPDVEFLRRVNGAMAGSTGEVILSYEVVNVGNVDVRSVEIRDEAGDFQASLDTLGVGQRRTFQQKTVVITEVLSAPVLTFVPADGTDETLYSIALDELELTPSYGTLSASLTAGHSLYASDSADVILRLANTGNNDYYDITVYDDVYGGIIADGYELCAGDKPLEIVKTYPIRGSASYRWRITATGSHGESIDIMTDTLEVPASVLAQSAALVLNAETQTPHISRGGTIGVTFELTNTGTGDATNVLLREETDGDVCTLAVIPTGEPFVFSRMYRVGETRQLTFNASWLDSAGNTHTVAAQPLEITVGRGGVEPIKVQGSLLSGEAIKQSSFDLIPALLLLSIGVLLTLLVVFVITSRRERFNRKVREAARRQQITGSTGRIPRVSTGNTGKIPRVSTRIPQDKRRRRGVSGDTGPVARVPSAKGRRDNRGDGDDK